ncbi:MAG: MFS transporter [Candidatus Lokiarchaeota archaeon]|nr:MFS transporter [Candidatus Lokiarchaeota archaeon]
MTENFEAKKEIKQNNLEAESWKPYFTYLTIYLSIFTFFYFFAITYRIFTINEIAAYLLNVNVKDMPFIFGFIGIGTLFVMFTRRIADLPAIGRKKATIIYGVVSLSFYLLSYFMYNVILFILIRLIGVMFAINLSSLIVSEEVPAKYRGRVSGIILGFGMMSSLLASYFSMLFDIFPANTWQLIFLFVNIPGIILIILLGLKMKETRRFESIKGQNKNSRLFGIFTKKNFKPLLLCSLIVLFIGQIFLTIKSYFKPYLLELGYSLQDIGILAIFAYIGSIIGYYASGFLSDHFGRKKAIFISLSIYFVGSIFFLFFIPYYFINIGFFIVNLTFSIFYTTGELLSAEFFPTAERSTAMGWITFFSSIGTIIGSLIITPISYLIGWQGVFLLIGNIGILGVIISIIFLPETKGRVLEEIVYTEIDHVT